MRVVSDERELIRQRINIVDLVGSRVQLKRSGKNFTGLCPFHEDRRPSFFVMPDSGRYKCFSCGEAGDAFTWVMKQENVDFTEALRLLAKQAGVELSSRKPGEESQRGRQLEAMKLAQTFFVEQLSKSSFALDYCQGRDLNAEVRETWGLGFAPADDHALATALKKAGFPLAECKELFLVEGDAEIGYHDKFRGRLMFPIHDERGELVAYGGRILGDGQPKYINSSDTPLFRKSRVLYGLHRAKNAIGKSRVAVLVEGYLDVIACHRAGVETAVASLGTSLAEDHAKLLKRWCDEVVVLYDSDAAGEKAAARACDVLGTEGLKVRVALMPPGEDPDTLLRTAGAAAVEKAAEGGLSPLAFRLMQIERTTDPNDPDFWERAIDALAQSPSPLEIEREAARLAGKYLPGSREGKVIQLMQQVRLAQREKMRSTKRTNERPGVARTAIQVAPLPMSEETVFRAFVEELHRVEAYAAIKSGLIDSSVGRSLAAAILDAFPNEPPRGKVGDWLDKIEPASIGDRLADLLVDVRQENGALHMKDRLPVSTSELQDVIRQLENEKDQRTVASLREQATGEDDLRAAYERMRKKFERQGVLGED